MKTPVGGGPKKIAYALGTMKRVGLKNSAKALTTNNTCKACGLGMGGQLGGMTNEAGEFPSVCNKSVQAQSTDIQAPIPDELLASSIADLREFSAKELEHLGRLNVPLYKAPGSTGFSKVEWQWALNFIAERLKSTQPDRSFFYSSGRSSNEAGFVLQLLARLHGTNNVNNCSFYCHQATGVGLGTTIGTGTSTVELNDLSLCDLVFVIGANPASNHPRFIHQLKAVRERGGHVVVINPAREPGLVKFAVPKSMRSLIAGGTDIASSYLQPKIGSDRYLLAGISKAVMASQDEDRAFIDQHCDGFEAYRSVIDGLNWDRICAETGLSQAAIEEVASIYGASKNAVFAWGMGITHHVFGSENVEAIASLALLRGMIARPGSGLLPLRGHSNVQGIGTIGVKPVLSEAVFEQMESLLQVRLPRKRGLDTFNALEAAARERIDFAMMVGGNLFSASPDSKWTEAALNKIGMKVYLTTTLNRGHLHGIDDGETLVLPVKARDEESQSTTQESMFNYVRLSDGGIDRIDNLRSEVDIIASIGERAFDRRALKQSFESFQRHDTIREAIAQTIPGMDQLKEIGVAKREFYVRQRLMHRPEFKTPNRRAQFIAPRELLVESRQPEDYPYVLASIRSEGQFNSIIYEETDSYRHDAGRDTLFMAASDMGELGLANGDRVDVVSRRGIMRGVRVRSFELPRGNLLAYYPEANVLTEHQLDPRSHTPNFKSIPVALRRTAARPGTVTG
ncbi:MAG: FdhF/YdeP family oxidoreductase [Pseudomonadota bacterium]